MMNFFVVIFLMMAISKILIIISPQKVMEVEYEICFIMCTIAEFVFFLIEITTPTKTENAIYRLMYQNAEISRCIKIMSLIKRIKMNIQQKKGQILKYRKFLSVEQLVKFAEEGTTDIA
ncbi:MAG: hypothetical protein UIM53_00775 [Acutalibacteraceae bacterium]|nr:hypothetical protein [Acutalibacteraceae bacterium]